MRKQSLHPSGDWIVSNCRPLGRKSAHRFQYTKSRTKQQLTSLSRRLDGKCPFDDVDELRPRSRSAERQPDSVHQRPRAVVGTQFPDLSRGVHPQWRRSRRDHDVGVASSP
jgi:hypothetical protein